MLNVQEVFLPLYSGYGARRERFYRASEAEAAWAAKLAEIRAAVDAEREALAAAMEPPVTGDPMDDRYLGMAMAALDALLAPDGAGEVAHSFKEARLRVPPDEWARAYQGKWTEPDDEEATDA